jgi:hypothetical protein
MMTTDEWRAELVAQHRQQRQLQARAGGSGGIRHAYWSARLYRCQRGDFQTRLRECRRVVRHMTPLDWLLQNRIPAKMISTQDPDRPSSRPVLPTSEAKDRPQP